MAVKVYSVDSHRLAIQLDRQSALQPLVADMLMAEMGVRPSAGAGVGAGQPPKVRRPSNLL